MTGHYTLMSCNGLEWIQPPSNQSRIPGSYGYYDPPLAIVNELNRLVDRIKRLEEAGDKLSDCADQIGWTSCESPQWIKKAENAVKEWRKAKEDKL